jgi:hypothetical protein
MTSHHHPQPRQQCHLAYHHWSLPALVAPWADFERRITRPTQSDHTKPSSSQSTLAASPLRLAAFSRSPFRIAKDLEPTTEASQQ